MDKMTAHCSKSVLFLIPTPGLTPLFLLHTESRLQINQILDPKELIRVTHTIQYDVAIEYIIPSI